MLEPKQQSLWYVTTRLWFTILTSMYYVHQQFCQHTSQQSNSNKSVKIPSGYKNNHYRGNQSYTNKERLFPSHKIYIKDADY